MYRCVVLTCSCPASSWMAFVDAPATARREHCAADPAARVHEPEAVDTRPSAGDVAQIAALKSHKVSQREPH
jgi:hypothetical protein